MNSELHFGGPIDFPPESRWIVYYGNGSYAGPEGSPVKKITEARQDWSWGMAVRHAERTGGLAIRCTYNATLTPRYVSTREKR